MNTSSCRDAATMDAPIDGAPRPLRISAATRQPTAVESTIQS